MASEFRLALTTRMRARPEDTGDVSSSRGSGSTSSSTSTVYACLAVRSNVMFWITSLQLPPASITRNVTAPARDSA